MMNSGEDPQGLIDVLYQFLNAEREIAPYFYDYYQSRPVNMDRFNALNREFALLPLAGKNFSTHAKQYQEVTRGIRQMYQY